MLGRFAWLGVVVLPLVACSSRDRVQSQTSEPPAPSATESPRLFQETSHPVEVRLGRRADAPLHLRDPRSRVGLGVRLRGTGDAAPVTTAQETVFPRGFLGRFDTVHRPVPDGVEDFIRFDVAPPARTVEYELTLEPEVAGLRLISNVLELLDAGGVPRVRMAPPWIEHAGVRHAVEVTVSGCRVDVDGRVPWERPVVTPGARTCVVRLGWSDAVQYPALLDPAWLSTGSVAYGHNNAATSVLANGDVLVVGGCTLGNAVTGVAEVYGASTGVWTMTKPIPTNRANHTATLADDGRVLVVGGDSATTGICFSTGSGLSDAYTYQAGTWTKTTAPSARAAHTASKLKDGRILVAGGRNGASYLTSADVWDPATSTWSSLAAMNGPRTLGGQVTLASGKVLVAGGYASASSIVSAAELWDPATSTWTATNVMAKPRAYFAMVAMPDGTALVLGGRNDTSTIPGYPDAIERYTTAGKWSTIGKLSVPRQNVGGLLLPSGNAIFVGGTQITGASSYITYGAVDLITADGSLESWPGLSLTRATPGLTRFGAALDRVMVVGGVTVGAVPKSVEITQPGAAVGATCGRSADCEISLICKGGRCAALPDAGADTSTDTSIEVGTEAGADSAAGDTAGDADSGAALGTSCGSAAACASGFCVDGVCCDAPCTSSCLSCVGAQNITGVDGACAPTKPGLSDPRGTCTDGGAASCGPNGKCDGAGGCANYPEGTACGGGRTCDGAGSCVSTDAGVDAGDGATDAPFTPIDPSATPTVPSGLAKACKGDTECASGHCVEGVCCDRPCSGSCESCVLPTSPGKCALVPLGLDPKRACSAIPCTRTCSGAGDCIAAFPGVQCSASRCTSASTGEGPTVCSAVGAGCPAAVKFDCGPYACDPAFGACLRDCRSSADCAPGNACDLASGRCVAAAPASDDGGCAVGPRGARGAQLTGLAGMALLALGAVRRRRR